MKRVLIIPALTAGGAERVMTIMANHWVAAGESVTLLTLDQGCDPPFFALDERVRHRPLKLQADSAHLLAAVGNNLRRVRVLRQALQEEAPATVISFLDSTNVLTLLASRGLNLPVIVAEHIDPARYHTKPAWVALRHWLYPQADRVVVLTERALDYFPRSLHGRCRVLPNPVPAPPMPTGLAEERSFYRLLAMGRLVEQKGLDVLLEAFALLSEDFPDWILTVLGDGPQRAALEKQARQLGVAAKVEWRGTVKRPESWLAEADLFVLPSRYEGFPMALCEAMAMGLPVVAADCPTGPREIMQHEVDGLLVAAENPKALAEGLRRLMASPTERQRLGTAACGILDRYGVERVMAMWETLLAGLPSRS